jgi:ribosomal protein S27E
MHVMHGLYYAHSSVGVHAVLLHFVPSPAGYFLACLDCLNACTITLSTHCCVACLACMDAICHGSAAQAWTSWLGVVHVLAR